MIYENLIVRKIHCDHGSVDKIMAYLNCPKCPAQSYPKVEPFPIWVGGFKLHVPLQTYKCSSGHIFYVEEEPKDVDSVHGRCV
jgi:hypothetical protein